MSELIGKTIGQYQITEQIGMGGMATVFKAYQASIDRYVAVKILPSQFAQDPNFVKRFEQEAKAIAALEHPHILPVHDFGTEGDRPYMVMRYVEGGTLTGMMDKSLSYKKIVRIVGNIARALNYAHQHGVVHRDIKPSNILIDQHGEVLLTDFGIAKMIEGTGATQLTSEGSILGTPAYMAPEQASAGQVDGRTDIYSLGVVLYELLTGQPPYRAETPLAVALMHLNEPLPPPRTIKNDIPEVLERVVLKALAKDPGLRFQTAGDMEQALNQALFEIESNAPTADFSATPTQAQGPGTASVEAPAKPKRSAMGPLLIGGGVVALLLCLLGSGLVVWALLAPSDETAGTTPTTSGVIQATLPATQSETPTPMANETPRPDTAGDNDSSDELIHSEELEGEIIFEEPFNSDANGWATGQFEDDYTQHSVTIEDGQFKLSVTSKQSAFVEKVLPNREFADFVLSLEATPQDSEEYYSYGVAVRENFAGHTYAFELGNDGLYGVFLFDGEWKTLKDWSSTKAIEVGQTNEITIMAEGNTLSFFINDQELATIEDDTLSEGKIGLIVEMFEAEQSATVNFDNLIIEPVSE